MQRPHQVCASAKGLVYPLVALLTSCSAAPSECLLNHGQHPTSGVPENQLAHYKGGKGHAQTI